ncbi:MAG TPA: alanine--tRNA ligase-related protein, partial [Candidatus Eisenbacteria bacterium]|nr:alanine--tRNA ligase-related protein [Candidatus Eisenbacteria bacterium]
ERSRGSSKIAGEIFSKSSVYTLVDGLAPTQFLGYEKTEEDGANLLRCVKGDASVPELREGEEGVLLFDKSPFYAESGGQVGDTGRITSSGFDADVLDTQKMDHCIGHRVVVKRGAARPEARCRLAVDVARRADVMKNHTATHILHAALRRVLGDHVKQSGSLVAAEYLRFDFTHFQAVGAEKLAEIEALVNAEVGKNVRLDKRELRKEDAMREGAIAFFGEKYGDKVRVVTIGDFSKELCGGTHLNATGEIGLFKITSESSIQAGVRRIEAVTGRRADDLLAGAGRELEALAKEFGAEKLFLPEKLKTAAAKVSALRATLTARANDRVRSWAVSNCKAAPVLGGARVDVKELAAASADLFQSAFEHLRSAKVSDLPFAVLWQCRRDDKVTFVVGASQELVQKGFHSGKIVKEVAAIVEGNGGGRPDFAMGGGKNVQKAGQALKAGEEAIRQAVSK